MKRTDERWRAAHHESVHIVVSLALRIPVAIAKIKDSGHGRGQPVHPREITERERVRQKCIISVAAPIASQQEFGDIAGCSGDRANSRRWLDSLGLLLDEAAELWDEITRTAAKLVANNPVPIRVLAEKLYEVGKLNFEEILTTLGIRHA